MPLWDSSEECVKCAKFMQECDGISLRETAIVLDSCYNFKERAGLAR